MGLEKIKEEILHKAATAEKKILAEATMKIEEIKKKAADKIKQLEKEAETKLKSELKSIENREKSLQNMESKKKLFELKKEIMDKVYHDAFKKIENIPKKDREPLIKKLLEDAGKQIDVHAVYANTIDKEFIKERIKIITLGTGGGIICETADGNVRLDYTFATLFQDLKEKTIKETSKILFD